MATQHARMVALLICVGCLEIVRANLASGQEIIALNDVSEGLPKITSDEPMATAYSALKAAEYLDRSALNWQKTKNCATCHTNLFYLAARPALRSVLPDSGEVRAFFEDYRKVRWQDKPPTVAGGFWPIVVGAGLAMSDAQSGGELSEVTKEVLDIMWTVQREDGGWNWPDCDYAPMEIDDHYGVTVALLAVGVAPGDYANSPQAQAGIKKLTAYLKSNPPESLHHRAMLAWCSARIDGITSELQRAQTLNELLDLQLEDGGWSTSGLLTDWKGLSRDDGEPLDTRTSDGYGTGLVIVIARELGVPADDVRLQRGIQWIVENQRESGKWFTRSPVNDAGNLISNVGSAFVVLALQACGELPGGTLGQDNQAKQVSGETEHFWYRLSPQFPYVDSQRGQRAFGFGRKRVFLSEDNCRTWLHSAEFEDADNITFSCLLKNGNVLFATREKLFLSEDNLKSIREIIVKNPDGDDYRPHNPKSADRPGWYFHSLDGVHTWDVEGKEIVVWGNYCNVDGGPVPVNIYYSTDNGRSVKIAYSFGQNPAFQEPDTDPQRLLGDRGNPLVCRHIHAVAYNPKEQAFYACTGDVYRGHGHECHWLRGVYDTKNDLWDWQVLVSVNANSRYKSGGINFIDGQLYFASDANGPKGDDESYDRGIFRCDPADLADPSKHTLLFNPEYEVANMIIDDGVILAGHYAMASPYQSGLIISPDLGKTWAQYDLPGFGQRSPIRFHSKNSDGWFRVDLRQGWIERSEVLFIKPKPLTSR